MTTTTYIETRAFIAAALGIAIVSASAALSVERVLWRTETVQRGLAIYCPQDGQWAWVGECEVTE